ncbi:YcjX family protein [Brucella intermedia]|nr:YcjX family protein [Brucella intermedia]PJR94617.1 amino acid regulated cytosolic protein [Ochrobactrum sp. 721/2009]PJT17902.1 amino acid regulated cytosolic protein [Ochrobactrum sp. 720/2009]PJT20964.1 amino acid regulated cytosolic protein [Ochrobactrum sp. 715/2009]PJT31237.1 amino acid regulated cytosolic protein [Ochrobactrum sp. 695/2009]PJT33263.1 amino acid regulated cytosolic protein [Ochrobactrum sp. 689/2009]
MAKLTSIGDEAKIALDTLADRATGLLSPSLRLGVTGLSRAGKTVFITALVHNMLHGGRLPMFEAYKSGRISRALLEPQPDDAVPRFQYEEHLSALIDERIWPDSTRAISQLRLTIEYESASAWGRWLSPGKLSVDIVDYPGEWLLDLPLLGKSYAEFSADSFALAHEPTHKDLAQEWISEAALVAPSEKADELTAQRLARSFTAYLRAGKADERALSTLPPGRFLMPGDLEGSPALTFAPLPNLKADDLRAGSLGAMMERRYEAYKTYVIKPFFREHIARLDRQIVLIDAMQAMNAGGAVVADLERALTDILSCFRPGRANLLTGLIQRRIGRILVAATKADHLHHESHDRLQAIVRRVVERAIERADFSGADIDVLAMAAVRATREATVTQGKETLPVIVGTPLKGEKIDGEVFDGETETAIFPGDLPKNPNAIFEKSFAQDDPAIRFVRFRPPRLERTAEGLTLSLPHIRLDRALQFLIGDRLA